MSLKEMVQAKLCAISFNDKSDYSQEMDWAISTAATPLWSTDIPDFTKLLELQAN